MPIETGLNGAQIRLILQERTYELFDSGIAIYFLNINPDDSGDISRAIRDDSIETDDSKQVIFLPHIELELVTTPGKLQNLLKLLLKTCIKNKHLFNALDATKLEISVPARVIATINGISFEHWVLLYLTPSKNYPFRPQNTQGYKLTIIDPAVQGKSTYTEKFAALMHDNFIVEFEDLSSDQALHNPNSTAYRSNPLLAKGTYWASGHILIDNILRVANQQLFLLNFIHFYIKKNYWKLIKKYWLWLSPPITMITNPCPI